MRKQVNRYDDAGATIDPAADGAMSRRLMLGRTGFAVTGALLGASVAAGAPAQAATSTASGQTGTIAAEFITRIEQNGADFVASGYLTRLVGFDSTKLFSSATTRSEATALLTLSANVKMVSQSIDGVVHALDLEGEMSIYQRTTAGASYATPSSFRSGYVIARYALSLHDVLTVIAPETGVPTLTGDMLQFEAAKLTGELGPKGVRPRWAPAAAVRYRSRHALGADDSEGVAHRRRHFHGRMSAVA